MDGEYVARMEHLLSLYERPYDPNRPLVCFDERSVQLMEDVHAPLPAAPGRVARQDYEYRRCGTVNLFLHVEPKAGWRHVQVTDQRTKIDFAQQMKYLVDERYPHAQTIDVVLDNLNTHTYGSLYEAFPADEAFRIAHRLAFHPTPKHGSWLSMAEIEFSVMARQCIHERTPDAARLAKQIAPWENERNAARVRINWRFNVDDARSSLGRLYPALPS